MIDKTTGNVVEDTESIHSWEYQADTSDGTEDSSDSSDSSSDESSDDSQTNMTAVIDEYPAVSLHSVWSHQ